MSQVTLNDEKNWVEESYTDRICVVQVGPDIYFVFLMHKLNQH